MSNRDADIARIAELPHFDAAWHVLFDEHPPEKHGQRCPYYLRRRDSPPRGLCDCWIMRGAHRRAAMVLAALYDLGLRPSVEPAGAPLTMAELREAVAGREHADGDLCTGLTCLNPDHGWLQSQTGTRSATRRSGAALNAGTHEPAVDDFGNQYLARLPTQASDSPEKTT